MCGVVVPDADRGLAEPAARHQLEGIADDELRDVEPEAREVGLHPLECRVTEGEAVYAHEALALVAEHCGDEARAVEDTHFDIRLALIEAASGDVQEREVVLPREVLDVLGDRRETPVDRVLRVREVLEEPRQLLEEAIGVHG